MKEEEESKAVECKQCEGTGLVYNDTTQNCKVIRGECCGGCGFNIECDKCEGTGEILEDN